MIKTQWLALIVLGLAIPATANPKAKRPDIIFIMTDDQAFDAFDGSGRFPWFRMPNVDRIADQGIRFNNTFCTTSICSPSRATCLTGLYSHKTGVPCNDPEVDPSKNVTFVSEILQKAGYETAFIGKWHMASKDAPRRGFDHWVSFKGQGVYNNPLFNINGKNIQVTGYTTDQLTDYAVDWLSTRPADKPLALFLWHKAPHAKLVAADRHKKLFEEIQITEPSNYRDSYIGKPEWQRRGLLYGLHREAWSVALTKSIPPSVGLRKPFTEKNFLPTYQEYFRTLVAVDESVGRVLDVLEKKQRRQNSLIIYTSDNGYNFFAHQSAIDKRTMWEESIRIPLVVQFPSQIRPATQNSAMVLNVDFAPTILQAAGIPIPRNFDGRPIQELTGLCPPASWRQSFLYIYRQEDYAPGIPTIVGVRNQRFKYITYPEEPEGLNELYDLKADPNEMRNVVNDVVYSDILLEMQGELETLTKQVDYPMTPMIR